MARRKQMDITLENIADLELPEDLENAILAKLEPKATPYLTGKGFVVKPQADYDSALATHAETAVNKAVKGESAKLYGSIDSLVNIALGETKPAKMSSRDWYAQLETEGKLPLTEANITKIRAAMKGESSATKDTVIEELRTQLEDKTKADEAKDKAAFTRTVNTAVNADLRNAPVVVSPELKDATAIATAKNATISDLKEFFNSLYEGKQDETTGEIYFVKRGTDKALMNVAEGRAMTPTEIFRANHPMYLAPAGHKQEGGGTGNSGGQGGGGQGGFKNAVEISAHAIKVLGYPAFSKEYNTFVADETKKLKK